MRRRRPNKSSLPRISCGPCCYQSTARFVFFAERYAGIARIRENDGAPRMRRIRELRQEQTRTASCLIPTTVSKSGAALSGYGQRAEPFCRTRNRKRVRHFGSASRFREYLRCRISKSAGGIKRIKKGIAFFTQSLCPFKQRYVCRTFSCSIYARLIFSLSRPAPAFIKRRKNRFECRSAPRSRFGETITRFWAKS